MKRFYLPAQITDPESLPSEVRQRLQTVILASIRRVAEQTSSGAQLVAASPDRVQPVRERFTAHRLNPEQPTYAIPSYDNGGTPIDVPVKQTGEATAAPPARLHWQHPQGNVAGDQVISGSSPFEDQLVAIFPGWQAVRVHADRYAMTTDLHRAVTWGNLLFGARSYVILEGPTGTAILRYYVIGTTHAPHVPAAPPGTDTAIAAGGKVWDIK